MQEGGGVQRLESQHTSPELQGLGLKIRVKHRLLTEVLLFRVQLGEGGDCPEGTCQIAGSSRPGQWRAP